MPNVIIRERDLTTNPSFTAVDVAYVPGLSLNEDIIGVDSETNENKNPGPVYCTTVSEFTKMFGNRVPKYTEPYDFDITYGPTGGTKTQHIVFKAGSLDCGYVYAKELLSAGIPIYYEAVNTSVEHLSAKDVYDAMRGLSYGEKQKQTVDCEYAEVESPSEEANPKEEGWYELDANDEYVLTEDTTVQEGKTYYTKTDGAGTFTAETSEAKAKLVFSFNNTKDDKQVTFAGINNFLLHVDDEWVEVAISSEYYTVKTTVEDDLVTKTINFVDLAVLENRDKAIIEFVDKVADGNLKVVYSVYVGEPSQAVDSCFLKLADRGTYNIKYLTSGGYPTFEYPQGGIVDTMINVVAAGRGGQFGVFGEGQMTSNTSDDCLPPVDGGEPHGRGDAIALIDHFNIPSRPLGKENPLSVWAAANEFFGSEEKYSYGAMFTPWCNFVLSNTYVDKDGNDVDVKTMELPLSFAYLKNLGRSIQYSENFLAIAGVARGTVDYIEYNSTRDKYSVRTDSILTNYIANTYSAPVEANRAEEVSINPLTRIRPYGEVIWGNRTLQKSTRKDGVKAQGFLNIRNMLSDIKKQCFTAGRELMFEPNSDVLWVQFRNKVRSLLEGLKNGGGLVDYSMTKSPKSGKTKLGVIISVTPLYALECVDILINITDEEVAVAESTEA